MYSKIYDYYKNKFPNLNDLIIKNKTQKLLKHLNDNKIDLHKSFKIENKKKIINNFQIEQPLKSISSLNIEPYIPDNYIIKKYYFFIDSRFRENIENPNENNYKIFFPSKIKNVIEIQLKNVIVPNKEYIINNFNNKFIFQEQPNENLEIIIPIGNYTINNLLNLIQNQMNLIGNSNYSLSQINNKIKFISDLSNGIFNLLFDIEDSIYNIIGFTKSNFYQNNYYLGDFEYNLQKQPSTFILSFPNIKNEYESLTFLITGSSNLISFNNKEQISKFLFPFDLSYLNIEWKDINENFINFYGKNHSILLCFSYIEYLNN